MFDNLGRLEPVDDGEPSPGFPRFISQSIFGAPSSSTRRLQAEQDSADKKHTVRDLLRSKAVEEYPLLIAAVMFFAAFFEEVAKVLALLVGFARVKEEIKATPTCCCCASFGLGDCRGYIIRRWEAFVFYGICVGFGFMLTENVKYFTMIGLSPDIGFKREDAEDQTWWMRRFLAVVRNVFNLHPILTGCSAARLAPFFYNNGAEKFVRLNHGVGPWDAIGALAFPVFLHWLYDAGSVFIMLLSPLCLIWFPIVVAALALGGLYREVLRLRTMKMSPDLWMSDTPDYSGISSPSNRTGAAV
eukprot:g8188.t1